MQSEPKITQIYDKIGKVLQSFKDEDYGWVSRNDIARRFTEMFRDDLRHLDKHDVRPYIPGMLSHYMGDNHEGKRPGWAPQVKREKSGSEDGYTFI